MSTATLSHPHGGATIAGNGHTRRVLGWIEPEVALKLAELAQDKAVVEIGSYLGLSTACLAKGARKVHSVDWHRGDAGCGDTWTGPGFLDGLRELGLLDRVVAHVGRCRDVLPLLPAAAFEMAFVDGSHAYEDVLADGKEALRLVKPGGTVAFHDADYDGVRRALALLFPGREPAGRCQSLCWYDVPATRPLNVFVALPCYDAIVPQALEGLLLSSAKATRYTILPSSGSLLALVFNRTWVTALNTRKDQGWTHYMMRHADIETDPYWLDQLVDELDRSGADILSAVVPIKDGRGLTSTGVHNTAGDLRRITMKELHGLPETFGIEDIPWAPPGSNLAVNTGLWVCRFDQDWVERLGDGTGFHILDAIHQDEGQVWRAKAMPEDWAFSRWAHLQGLRVMATRKVRVVHHGRAGFANDHVWGTYEHDEGDK